MPTLSRNEPITTSPTCTPAEILAAAVVQGETIADPAAAAALTFTGAGIDTGTDMTAAQKNQLVADILALRTAIVANKAAIDAILAALEAAGILASA